MYSYDSLIQWRTGRRNPFADIPAGTSPLSCAAKSFTVQQQTISSSPASTVQI